jgi:hypothetical protein
MRIGLTTSLVRSAWSNKALMAALSKYSTPVRSIVSTPPSCDAGVMASVTALENRSTAVCRLCGYWRGGPRGVLPPSTWARSAPTSFSALKTAATRSRSSSAALISISFDGGGDARIGPQYAVKLGDLNGTQNFGAHSPVSAIDPLMRGKE